MKAGDESPIFKFAAATVGLPQEATSEALRTELLRRLRDEDYFLDHFSHEAVTILCGLPETHAPRLAESVAFAELTSFAVGYFDLPVEERRRRWDMLSKRCLPYPHLLRRLQELKAGLDVDARRGTSGTSLEATILSRIGEIYVLPAAKRSARRHRIVDSLRSNPTIQHRDLARAVRTIRRSYPQQIRLVPEFLADLSSAGPSPAKIRLIQALLGFKRVRRNINSRPFFTLFIIIITVLLLLPIVAFVTLILVSAASSGGRAAP